MNKTALNVLIVAGVVLGFLLGCMTTRRFDLGGAQKVAYDDGFRNGLGNPKPVEEGVKYITYACSTYNTDTALCMAAKLSDSVGMEYISVLHTEGANKLSDHCVFFLEDGRLTIAHY